MLGAVIITLASNSCSSLCLKTSMCSSPRNPIHHPGPRAALTNETQVRKLKTYHSLTLQIQANQHVENGSLNFSLPRILGHSDTGIIKCKHSDGFS